MNGTTQKHSNQNQLEGGDPKIADAVDQIRNLKQYFLVNTGIADRVIEEAGGYPGKRKNPVSLATHLINTTLVGLTAYGYDITVRHEKEIDEEAAKILTAALVLHDANKYINERDGTSHEENSNEVLNEYFEDDDFGVKEIIDEEQIAGVKYLIQRTEVTEDASETRASVEGLDVDLNGLERYCRIGDTLTSRIIKDGLADGAKWLETQFSIADPNPVQHVSFTRIEQPILNNFALGTLKKAIQGEYSDDGAHGVIIGSTPEALLYLGRPIDRYELRSLVSDRIGDELRTEFKDSFSPKADWRGFDYDILEEVDLDYEVKREAIAEAYVDILERGQGGFEGFENVPESFQKYLPELVKAIYVDKRDEFGNEQLNQAYQSVYEEVGGQKAKVYYLVELLRNFEEYEGALIELKGEVASELREDLSVEGSALTQIVDRYFSVSPSQKEIQPSGETCFLCGAPAEREYQKGQGGYYGTNAFSKRVGPEQSYKRICPACNLEYELLVAQTEAHEHAYVSGDVNIAYLYFSEFLGDLTLFEDGSGGAVSGTTMDLSDPQPSIGLFDRQYRLLPFNTDSRSSDTVNERIQRVRQLLGWTEETGMKATIDKPFRRFDPTEAVFVDAEATRLQRDLGLDEVLDFDSLERARHLLDILAQGYGVDGVNNPYLTLRQDSFPELADLNYNRYGRSSPNETITSYIETYHHEEFMKMQKVAEEGIDLFGKQFGSKHKKTKIFRTATEATLDGLSRSLENDELEEHVAGQVYEAARQEQWAGHVEHEDARTFVERFFEYLEEDDSLNIKSLADRQNVLTNTYLYAFDSLLYEDEEEETETTA